MLQKLSQAKRNCITIKSHHNSLQYLTNYILRFNVDCEASTGLYAAAEGAFGTAGGEYGGNGDDVGECPAPALSGDQCAGAVSNCWSPGQRDTGQLNITSLIVNN